MTLSRKSVVLAAVLMLMTLSIAASAGVVAHSNTEITGVNAIGKIICDATVTQDLDGFYTYNYVLDYQTGTATVKTHRVQNPNGKFFFDAANAPDDAGKFLNPVDGAATYVNWTNGTLLPGQTRTFSYRSQYAPMLDIYVWEIVIDGGSSAYGKTLGMGAMIPEPSSLAALLLGVGGLIPLAIRRRK